MSIQNSVSTTHHTSINHQNHQNTSSQVTLTSWWDLIPYTWLGWLCLLLAGFLKYTYGEQEGDYVIITAATALMLILLLLVVLAWIEGYRVRTWLQQRPDLGTHGTELEVSQWFATGFNAQRPWALPLFQLQIEWRVPSIKAYELQGHSQKLLEFVVFARRGQYSHLERYISCEDIFGFTRMTFHMHQICQWTVLPENSQSIPINIQQMQVGEDHYDAQGMPQGDLVEQRRYQAGDPNKLIIWRLYARNRQLMVRSPERALSLKQDLLAYFVADPTDEASAITTRTYLDNGFLGQDFSFIADGAQQVAHDTATAMSQLLNAAHADALTGFSLLQSVDLQKQQSCLIFASALTDPSILHTIQQRLPHPPTFILSYPDEIHITAEQNEVSSWKKWWKLEQTNLHWSHGLTDPMQSIIHLQQSLLAKNCQVIIITQPTGEIVSEMDLQQLTQK